MKPNKLFIIFIALIMVVQPTLIVKTSPVKAAGIRSSKPSSTVTSDFQIDLPLISNKVSAERAALMALYYSTDGANWFDNSGWNTGSPYCTWEGVTCDGAGHVTSLILYKNHLEGTIPPAIGDLVYLQSLNLSNDPSCPKGGCQGDAGRISGPIPAEIGKLVNLQELNLSYNGLSNIPPEISNLVNLQTLDLEVNWLNGPIPPYLGNLVKLEQLILWGNFFSGPIPAELSNLSNLNVLHLALNPDLECWETQEALDWALALSAYYGPDQVCSHN